MTLLEYLSQAPIVTDAHDLGVRAVAAFSARFAYLSMALTLSWGILTATGWVRWATGHQALRGGHMVLASFTLAAATVHAVAFQLLNNLVLTWYQTIIPFFGGSLIRHGLGVISLELMAAIAITAGLYRFFRYRNWLRFHQLAYVAVALGAVHAWLGAYANGHLSLLWIGGITATAPMLTLCLLRFVPQRVLVAIRLIEGEVGSGPRAKLRKDAPLALSVDNVRCHRYGFCQTEAPEVFKLLDDGRLQYKQHPEVEYNRGVHSAVRACPMQAIHMSGVD